MNVIIRFNSGAIFRAFADAGMQQTGGYLIIYQRNKILSIRMNKIRCHYYANW